MIMLKLINSLKSRSGPTMRLLTAATVVSAAILNTGLAQAAGGDVARGAEKAGTVCAACHGPDGNSQIPTNPILAGQYEDYIVQALKSYREGSRQSAIMAGFAGPLTDQEIADLAAYFSSQKGPLQTAPRN